MMRMVLKRVKTRKCKFDSLIIMNISVTYIGGMLPQDNKNTNGIEL